ncbi:MAG: hypothetical protein NT027_00565, partial [Proteobacteria bacterium]|nr:hypothetical protein [Pseudomonadota bacterium]
MARRMTSTITAKLFYLITSLVVLIVVGMTIQSTNKYKVSLTQAIQDGALSQAERAATDISTQIDGTIAKVSVTLPKISTLSEGKGNSSSEFRNLLRNDPEILAASVFLVDKDKPRQIISIQSPYPNKVSTDNRYLGKSPSDVKAKVLNE